MSKSTIITYSANIQNTGTGNGSVSMLAPLQLDPQIRKYFRLIKCNFSKLLANIHNLTTGPFIENNGLIRVSQTGGAPWTSIQLENGLYTVFDIELAINKSVEAWWALPTDPGFKIRGNASTQRTYTILDSTKLAVPGQLAIDYSSSLIWNFLGYSDPLARTFILDGEYDSASFANVNWFGDSLSLVIRGLGPISLKNGAQSFEAANIPIVVPVGSNEVIYPLAGVPSPKIPLPQCPSIISQIDIALEGANTSLGTPITAVILQGELVVQFELSW